MTTTAEVTSAARPRRGVPLRVSLVALTLVLVTLGLLVSGIAVTTAMRNDLMSRTDKSLREAAAGWARPRALPPGEMDSRDADKGRPPTPYYVQINRSDGTTVVVNDTGEEPDLSDPTDFGPEPVTVQSADGDGPRWRVVETTSPFGTALVAVQLDDVDDTLSRLIWLQVGIGAGVIVVVGALGYLLVRTSLRPLERVESTAHAIAAGDLNQRVPPAAANTEVGSLAASINTMLHQIQGAFAASAASEDQARRSEENMRRFVADASHELRTPLTSIMGFAELYRQGAMTDTKVLMSRVETEAGRMGLLVEDLLILARLDAQRPLERAPVDLLALASDVVHSAKAGAPDRTISVEVFDGPGIPEVSGDAARLAQVLSNLVGNAILHTPDDASITVRVGTVDNDAVLSVSDTGPGLSEEDGARVFERFYRADASRHRTDNSSGSGLGLSIVAALVAAHGGTVGVDSEPGAGATFWVRIPRDQVSP
ncbi:cell wall metabolism sensor histidine kinase WalK [Nocardia sp. 348MFTsu5.1]|uniref:sensor histidine kinase n=1 Tax=Nocardia sp. 348MFTsu5.1 TaxID=1172185 RepID=UPI00037D7EDB|nr:HAMP domain-containing sensor histidine kinase [Nocardia sp. 348MFTsu5.1]